MSGNKTTTKEIWTKCREIPIITQELKRMSGLKYEDDGINVVYDINNPEEVQLRRELEDIFLKLINLSEQINYLNTPVTCETHIYKNSAGRYETETGFEYSCGYGIEFLHPADDYEAYPYWETSRIEHNGEDYYIVNNREVSLDGLPVRIR